MSDSDKLTPEISYRSELQRKFLHLIAIVIPVATIWLGKSLSLWILIPLSLVALGSELARVRSEKAAAFIYGVFGSIMRSEEKPPVGGPVVINGATWVMLSATLLTLIFPVHIGGAALAMFMLGDAAAALIGRKLGRLHWPRSRKTLEGSLGFVVVSGLTLALFGLIEAPLILLLVAITAALLEVLPIPMNDNVRVPILIALLLFLLLRMDGDTTLRLFF